MIKCIAMDDEPLVLEQLRTYLSRIPFLEVVAVCHDAYEGARIMEEQQIDAIFTDINMPDLNGLDFVRSLEQPPLVVFTTAYPDYAIDGYKVSAVDYVLKPFGFEDILEAAKKVKRQYDLKASQPQEQQPQADYIYVRADHRQVRVDIADIAYVEAMNEYVNIHLADGQNVVTFLRLRKLEECLPEPRFLRIHRSYVVNMDRVRSVSKTSVQMADGASIPIGDNYKERVLAHIQGRILDR